MTEDEGKPSKPVPDPTILTTQNLRYEVGALSDRVDNRIDGFRSTVETRFNAMDKAVDLFETNLKSVPANTDKHIRDLKELHHERFNSAAQRSLSLGLAIVGSCVGLVAYFGEKFNGVQTQIRERDSTVAEKARDTKVAVDAALSAQKEAVATQTASTTKQIDGIGALISTSASGADKQIGDLKERLTRVESGSLGMAASDARHSVMQGSQQSVTGLVMGGIAVLLALGGVVYMAAGKGNESTDRITQIEGLREGRSLAQSSQGESMRLGVNVVMAFIALVSAAITSGVLIHSMAVAGK